MADFEIISTIRNFSQVCDYTFTSIPQTYKHLYIIGTGGDSNSNYGATGKWKLLFNGDTGSNWNVSNWASMNQTTNNRQVQVSNEANNYIARTPTQFTFSGDCGFEIWIPNYSSNSSGQPAKCFSLKQFGPMQESSNCLLYTSDAADE